MARFNMNEAPDELEVELADGHVFVIKDLTKHVGERSRPIAKQIQEKVEGDPESGDDIVPLIGEYLDVMLKRTGNGDQPASKPSTLLKKAWEADKLSEDKLVEVWAFVATRGATAKDDGAPPT